MKLPRGPCFVSLLLQIILVSVSAGTTPQTANIMHDRVCGTLPVPGLAVEGKCTSAHIAAKVWADFGRKITIRACRGDDLWELARFCGERFGGMGEGAPYSTLGHEFAVDMVARHLATKLGSVTFERTAAAATALLDARKSSVQETATHALQRYQKLYLEAAEGRCMGNVWSTTRHCREGGKCVRGIHG